MDPYEFVISVLALNQDYNNAITNGRGVESEKLKKGLLSKDANHLLDRGRIMAHPIHEDSPTLDSALYQLMQTGVLKMWTTGSEYFWDFPSTPQEYFEKKIKPNLSKEKFSQLEEFAKSLEL